MVLGPTKFDGNYNGLLCTYMHTSSQTVGQTRHSAGTFKDAAIVPEMSSIAFFPGKWCEHSVNSVNGCCNITAPELSDGALSQYDQNSEPTHISVSGPDACSVANGASTLNGIISGSFRLRLISLDAIKGPHSEVDRTNYVDQSLDMAAGRS